MSLTTSPRGRSATRSIVLSMILSSSLLATPTAEAFFSPSHPISHSPLLLHNHNRQRQQQHYSQHPQGYSPPPPPITSSRSASTTTLLSMRGGALASGIGALTSTISSSPKNFFNANLAGLAVATASIKLYQRTKKTATATTATTAPTKSPAMKSLQIRFLSVFWLLRCADWLQGPYFYETYASKVFNGVPATLSTVSNLFLTGFASTALFGPIVGRMSDSRGRKRGTLAFAVLYMLGAASTKSSVLKVLLLGRVLGGIGTSLLFSAPEAWLVSEAGAEEAGDVDGRYLGETFGLAYAGDSLVAILAGQLAGVAASKRGPTGPFELSIGFLAIGGLLASFLWKENKAEPFSSSTNSEKIDGDNIKSTPTIRDAVGVVKADPKIMLVGLSQSFFEAAMYIFVLQWPPAITEILTNAFASKVTADGAATVVSKTPYGTIFSCFMACCLLGSTIFGQLSDMGIKTETSTAGMLSIATLAMGTAAFVVSTAGTKAVLAMPFAAMVAAFFAFEACVGLYFPSIGTLRSKYLPDSHRTVIMNLFGIPLNALVVSVFLSIKKLGVSGALSVSTCALALATASMLKLKSIVEKEAKQLAVS